MDTVMSDMKEAPEGKVEAPRLGVSGSGSCHTQLWIYRVLVARPCYLVGPQIILLLNADLLNSLDYYEGQIIGLCVGFANYRVLNNN